MRYAVVERLGRGGMGVVDLGTDADGRQVALKRVALHGSAAAMAEARRRIRREAEILASLDHPGIVPLVEVLDDGDDIVLVMPFVAGGSLSDAVAQSGPLPATAVADIAAQLLPALAAAHRQGVVHRDVKPSNVLLDGRGGALLADFGVAVTRDVTVGLTASDLVVGTPAFMAPEQARGEPAGPAADVFALGATLRWALTGAGPYGAGDAALLVQRAAAGKVHPVARQVPGELRLLLRAACAPDPARRPTAAALAGGPQGTAVRTLARPRHDRVLDRLARSRAVRVAATLVVAAAAVALGANALVGGNVETAASTEPPVAAPAPPCTDLPYQPCGADPAPGTNGERCLAGRDDYDAEPTNGCEAAADDTADGTVVERGASAVANLVPRDDVDTWHVDVPDRFQLLCDGAVRVTFAAAPGVAQQLRVLEGDQVLATTSSADATPVSLRLSEPSCGQDDSTRLSLVVSSVGSDRSGEAYLLEVDGSY